MLVWNQYDFIECLGVLPEVDEDELYNTFEVVKDGLKLALTIYPYDNEVYLELNREGIEPAALSMKLTDCPGARYVKCKNGVEYLEFAAARAFGSRYDGESLIPMGVRLTVDPHIRIELF